MNIEKELQTYKRRLAKEGWIKATMCGIIVGFTFVLIAAIVSLIIGQAHLWIYIATFTLGAALTPLFYFKHFKYTTRQVAAKVDMLGLEERVLTATQLEHDNSYMARRQREDTLNTLKKVNDSMIKISVSIPLIVLLCGALILGVGAATASTLVDKGLIEIINEPQINQYDVIYGVKDEKGGAVYGKSAQTVSEGLYSELVEAVAYDNYVFVGWSDGVDTPRRTDLITADFEVYALFELIVDVDEEIEDDERGDEPRQPGDDDQHGEPLPIPAPDEDGESAGAGGTSNPSDQVIDGSTWYGHEYGNSLSEAGEALSNSNIGDSAADMIGGYFNNIAK